MAGTPFRDLREELIGGPAIGAFGTDGRGHHPHRFADKRIIIEDQQAQVGTLKGTVRSWAERQEAERAAWRAPGVVKVDNRIVVSP
ncbi:MULTISPECIES: BON domain-containing protein [Devosia]|uniref:BON domain-containing protein n=1 Tax=Devosia TaxID=46913 RepID=UPI00316AD0DD